MTAHGSAALVFMIGQSFIKLAALWLSVKKLARGSGVHFAGDVDPALVLIHGAVYESESQPGA